MTSSRENERERERHIWAVWVSVLISFAQFLLGPMHEKNWTPDTSIASLGWPEGFGVQTTKSNHHQCFWHLLCCSKVYLDGYPLQPLAYRRKKPVLYLQMKLLYLGELQMKLGTMNQNSNTPFCISPSIWSALPFCLLFPAHNSSFFFATLSINHYSVFAYSGLRGDLVLVLCWDVQAEKGKQYIGDRYTALCQYQWTLL